MCNVVVFSVKCFLITCSASSRVYVCEHVIRARLFKGVVVSKYAKEVILMVLSSQPNNSAKLKLCSV